MKTAISIPDDLFHEVEACSRRLRMSRSQLFASAAREYLSRHGAVNEATQIWNQVITAAGQPGDERAVVAGRALSKAVVRATTRKRR